MPGWGGGVERRRRETRGAGGADGGGVWGGALLLPPTRGLGERRKLPYSGVRGGAPAANDFGT